MNEWISKVIAKLDKCDFSNIVPVQASASNGGPNCCAPEDVVNE